VLVWSDSFQTRDDAFAAEWKIKGWSRAKKEALIVGDWRLISQLARGRTGPGNAGRGGAWPSTSSG
jgi:putative endonuclease